jgi:mannose-6-phosphate isomerase-like protein (cupin superfamily)
MAGYVKMTDAWPRYFAEHDDFLQLIAGIKPVFGGCGWLYEVPDMPLVRSGESLAVAIMDKKELPISEPHYHPENTTEMYIVLEGKGVVIVGDAEYRVAPRSTVTIGPKTAHFTVPYGRLVMAVVITPPFSPECYIKIGDLTKSDAAVKFDADRFRRNTPREARIRVPDH